MAEGDLWTAGQLAAFQRRWEQASTPAARAKHMRREMRRLLPLRTCLRLWWHWQLTSAGVWMLDHAGERACVALWRVTGLWGG